MVMVSILCTVDEPQSRELKYDGDSDSFWLFLRNGSFSERLSESDAREFVQELVHRAIYGDEKLADLIHAGAENPFPNWLKAGWAVGFVR